MKYEIDEGISQILIFMCLGVMRAGENDVCDFTHLLISTAGKLKNTPDVVA